jgi:hypothetical protein
VQYDIAWGGDPEDVLLTTRGRVSVGDLHEMIRAGLADPQFREGMKILIDHTQATWWSLSNEEILDRAELIRADAEKIGRQRVAFVMGSKVDFGIGRMLQSHISDLSRIQFEVFGTAAEARAWLEQQSA